MTLNHPLLKYINRRNPACLRLEAERVKTRKSSCVKKCRGASKVRHKVRAKKSR
ncbi:hypothetical protein COLO4_25498 [Corchorus olitorius]|uniref:Uncharacterized protein n=1 Tax=Corchorus olitorius TaxID=93759 RepID=A0A1R3I242_9ROSI|nr:hypothetical protein COLO4_25498 [Corchorus olitorius]